MDEVGTSKEGEPQPLELAVDENLSSSSSESLAVRWRPSHFLFCSYSPAVDNNAKPQTLRVVVRRPVVARLTKDIVETYKLCNPQFHYLEELNPKRFLMSPSIGVLNDGYDNANSDLILSVNFVLVNLDTQRRYIVKDILGHGTFGQVAKCWVAETNSFVAIKIIKNQPAYYQQALVEVSILTTLNRKFDAEDKHHIVRIYDYFVHHHHLCIAFELLDTNLYELIKINHFRGLSLSIVQLFSKQILRGLSLMKDAGIVHCDLKPENILLCTRVKSAEIKIIDFGSACMEDRTVYSYIQSRYYRSPEVLLGYQYTTAIDMWSFGCIVAELFLGLPLFPGASEFDLLRRMIKILGGQPPDYVLKEAKNSSKFFKFVGNAYHDESLSRRGAYLALTEEEYEAASKHPFVTGEPFTCPYKPPPETPHMPVFQNFKMDHHPAGGHWFAAGLSPNLSGRTRVSLHNSPHFQVVPYAYSGSYGSLGSHGSYNDSTGLGSGNGSYGDNSSMLAYYSPVGPSGMKGDVSIFGSSPDARWRIMQLPPGNGLGVSPAGNFAPMPLGTSPSQFTPPSSHSQVSAGSPGHYGPTSPARGSCHGSPLGKVAAVSQFNKRKSWGYHGSLQSQESSSSLHWQGQVADGTISDQAEGNSPVLGGSPLHLQSNSNAPSWMLQRGDSGISAGYSATHNLPGSLTLPNMQFCQPMEAAHDKPEASLSLPDPGDWDPNYSEELLLQEDGSDLTCMATEFGKGMQLGQALIPTESSVCGRRSNRVSSTISVSTQRSNGPIQSFSIGEVGNPLSGHDLHGGYARPITKPLHFMPHWPQSSPSRLGQQHIQRFNYGRSTAVRGTEWNLIKVQPSLSNFNSGGPGSPGNSLFSYGTSWGHRGNHPISNIPPQSRGRKDYGRIA